MKSRLTDLLRRAHQLSRLDLLGDFSRAQLVDSAADRQTCPEDLFDRALEVARVGLKPQGARDLVQVFQRYVAVVFDYLNFGAKSAQF